MAKVFRSGCLTMALLFGGSSGYATSVSRPSVGLVPSDIIRFSTYFGGTGEDNGIKITQDAAGYIYVLGFTSSADFPTSPDAFHSNGAPCAVVVKFSLSGTVEYSTMIPGCFGTDIAVDLGGNAYVTGYGGRGFTTTPGAYRTDPNGDIDLVIAKLNPNGSDLVYSTFFGSGGEDQARGVTVDVLGNAYIVGDTSGEDFPTVAAVQRQHHGGGRDGFVSVFNSQGTDLLMSTFLGGRKDDSLADVAIDNQGTVHVTGLSSSNDLPITDNAVQRRRIGGLDAMLASLGQNPWHLEYCSYIGGSADDSGFAVAVGPGGDLFVAGRTDSADFPTTSAAVQDYFARGASVLGGDGFVSRFEGVGGALGYSTFLGGTMSDPLEDLVVLPNGQALVVGTSTSPDYPTTCQLSPQFGGGFFDGSVTTLTPNGQALTLSSFFGGSGNDSLGGISSSSSGDSVVVVGTSSSLDLPIVNAVQPTLHGTSDIVITGFNLADPSGCPAPVVENIVIKRKGNVVDHLVNGVKGKQYELTIEGTSFDSRSRVLADGRVLSTSFMTENLLVARFPQGRVGPTGILVVRVLNIDGSGSGPISIEIRSR